MKTQAVVFAFVCVLALLAIAPAQAQQTQAAPLKCAYACLNGGECNTLTGTCKCKRGFVGVDCARLGCAGNCNQRGYCDLSSTPPQCLCQGGWSGGNCRISPQATAQANKVAQIKLPAATTTTAATKPAPTPVAAAAPKSTKSSRQAAPAPVAPAAPIIVECKPACAANSGVCHQGQCLCANGFTGLSCEQLLCPNSCSGRGNCDNLTGVCDCYAPYTGRSCEGIEGNKPAPKPRTPDDVDDFKGAEQVKPIKKNQIWTTKPGLSDGFHMIEVDANHQQQEQPQQ